MGKFTESDIVIVSGAAGATGSILGQIAKKIQKAKKVFINLSLSLSSLFLISFISFCVGNWCSWR